MEGSVLLGNHSLKQLNIISNTSNNKLASITNFYMNSCKTSMGKREIKKILQIPYMMLLNLTKCITKLKK